ncbi:hypothetical protein F5Y17DRAFT_438006 [Xylariaceae sp. FL0594]|nr:hypothetical protein F5Y17DRAFT_438006 [Xylariaceae sp. FL0594]
MKIMFLFSLIAESVCVQEVASLHFNVTAIGARNGSSTLECWQMAQSFNTSNTPGTTGTAQTALGSVASLSYTVIPPNFDGGIHNAPHNQWVVFLSGLAYITLPGDNCTSAYVSGGEFGTIFAADIAAVSTTGHRTQYPGTTETIALQIPTQDDTIPEHQVLHDGPCSPGEISGIREFAMSQANPQAHGAA